MCRAQTQFAGVFRNVGSRFVALVHRTGKVQGEMTQVRSLEFSLKGGVSVSDQENAP